MPIPDDTAGPLVLINTFTVEPQNAEPLLEALDRASEAVMRHQPGFLSASFHVSLDRTRVANDAEWRTKADFEAMLQNAEARAHMGACIEQATRFEPILYARVSRHEA